MEMTDRLGTLPLDIQLKAMEKLFQKLLLSFGNQLLAKWQGIDMNAVYADWAEALRGYTLGAINHGITLSKEAPHPPNQGEFIKHCGTYLGDVERPRLERTWTPEEIEKNQQRLAEMVATLKGRA